MKVAKKLMFIFAAFLVVALSMISVTYAWIRSADNTIHTVVSGKVVQERFHTGDGTQSNPYVITKPIHYYHMVEFFQRETSISVSTNGNTVTSNFGTDFIYFQLGYDFDNNGVYKVYAYNDQGDIILDSNENPTYSTELNMAYYSESNSLMPIGTSYIPFFGIFDGKGLTIKNLNIISSEDIPNPANLNETITRKTADIGIFGYVKQASGISGKRTIIKDTYFENVTISLVDVDASVTCAGHISNDHETAYVGYLAGHVTIDETITNNSEKKIFVNTYINNCTVTGGNAAKSNYGLFGRVDNSQGVEMETLEETITSHIGTDPGINWGGSIDMLSLNKRIMYFLNNISKTGLDAGKNGSATKITYNKSIYTKSSSNVFRYYVDDYQSYSTYSGADYSKDPASNKIIYRFVGGASNARATTSNPTSTSGTYFYDIPPSYVPLLTKGEADGYAVEAENTGYFAGDLMHGSNTLRTASYQNTFIGKSYANGELEVLSNSTASYNASNYKKINNGHNNNLLSGYSADISPTKYPGYASAYEKMCNVLSSSTFVQGLHFTGSTISSSSTTTIPKAYINGELITNYKTLRSAVDFYAKENGSIKFFAGSYYNTVGTNADSFFSLHTVTRSGSTITTNQIYYIYANTNDATKKIYPHLYYDSNNNLIDAGYGNNVTKGDLEFDMRWLHDAPPVENAVYYFEIPVNAGEFALGSVASNKTKGAYLMYLDIGTNGNDEVPQSVDTIGNAITEIFDVDFRTSPDVLDNHNLFQIAYDAPDDSLDNFDITVYFDKSAKTTDGDYDNGLYIITITNESGSAIRLTVYLRDNDNNADNKFPYAYKIILNGSVLMNNTVDYWKVCKTHIIPSS